MSLVRRHPFATPSAGTSHATWVVAQARSSRIASVADSAFVPPMADPTAADNSVAAMLDRMRAAVGYDRIASHPTGIEARGRATICGVDASHTLLFQSDGRSLQRLEGELTLATAINGETVWISDLGGETRAVVGADRDSHSLGVLMFTHGYLAPAAPLTFSVDNGACLNE